MTTKEKVSLYTRFWFAIHGMDYFEQLSDGSWRVKK